MSELTKIAAIFAKHLSNALLSVHSELTKLEESQPAAPLSQTGENEELVSLETVRYTKRENYKVGDRVMVMLDGAILPIRARICDVLQGDLYLAYFFRAPKSSAREIRHDQILGLDPDR